MREDEAGHAKDTTKHVKGREDDLVAADIMHLHRLVEAEPENKKGKDRAGRVNVVSTLEPTPTSPVQQ